MRDTRLLTAALKDFAECAEMQIRGGIADPEWALTLRAFCDQHGYGNVMYTVSQLWREKDDVGAFTVGHCVGTVKAQLMAARKALKEVGGGL
jgi:hypothetical protein